MMLTTSRYHIIVRLSGEVSSCELSLVRDDFGVSPCTSHLSSLILEPLHSPPGRLGIDIPRNWRTSQRHADGPVTLTSNGEAGEIANE